MTPAMLFFANILLLLAGTALLVLVARAGPTRGENLVGLHLILFPIALALTLALGLGIATSWASAPFPTWPLYAVLPGFLFTMVGLPFACFSQRGAGLAKLFVLSALVGLALALNGHLLAPAAHWTGGGIVALLSAGAFAMPVAMRLRTLLWRIRAMFFRWRR